MFREYLYLNETEKQMKVLEFLINQITSKLNKVGGTNIDRFIVRYNDAKAIIDGELREEALTALDADLDRELGLVGLGKALNNVADHAKESSDVLKKFKLDV